MLIVLWRLVDVAGWGRGGAVFRLPQFLDFGPGPRHQNQCFAVGDVLYAWHRCLDRYALRTEKRKKYYEAQRGWPQIHHLVYMKRKQHTISRSPLVNTTGIISYHQNPADGAPKAQGNSLGILITVLDRYEYEFVHTHI